MPGQNSDGAINIDTRIDTSGVAVGIKKMHELVDRFHRTVRNVGQSMRQSSTEAVNSMREVDAAYSRATANATQTEKAVKQVNAQISRTEKKIATAEAKLADYHSAINEIKAGTDRDLRNTTKDDQAAYLLEVEEQMIGNVNEQYATQLQELAALKKELAGYQAQLAAISAATAPAGESGAALKDVGDELEHDTEKAGKAAAAMSFLGNAFRSVATTAARAAMHVAQVTGRTAINGIKNLWRHTKNAARSFLTLGRNAKRTNIGLGASFKTLLKYGLGIRSIYALFNKLRAAIKEGFGNLARYSDSVNQCISSVMSSLTKLKNQLAATFAPLVEAGAPVLNTLIEGLTDATAKLGQLIAAMSGNKTFTEAKDVQEDYAKSLDKTGKSAKDAKRQLAGFDELEILKDTDSGKTDPKDMFEESEIPEEIETLADEITDGLESSDLSGVGSVLGERIKKAFDGIDWNGIKAKAWELGKKLATLLNGVLETPGLFYSVGKTVAEAINTAFSFIDGFAWNFHWDSLGTAIMDTLEGICDNLDWTLINHALQGVARGFAETLNTIFARRGTWEKVGTTFGNALNAVVSAALTFLRDVDFLQAGATIAAGLNAAVKTIKWSDIGALLAEGVGSALEFIYSAVSEFDWGAFASGIAAGLNTFFSNLLAKMETLDWEQVGVSLADGVNHLLQEVDWSNIARTLGKALTGLLDLLIGFLGELDWFALGDAIADAILGIHWDEILVKFVQLGGYLIGGLLLGMFRAIARIGQWIKENIVDPIVNWFKKLFDINSPSKVMAEIGGYLIDGLLEGMLSGVKNIGKWLKKNLVQPIQKFFKDPIGTIKLAVDDTWTATQQVWESVKDSEAVKTISGFVLSTFDRAKAAFDTLTSGSVVKTVSGFLDKTFDAAKDTFNNFRDGDVFKHVKGVVDSAFHVAKNTFDAFINGDVFKVVKGKIDEAYTSVKSTFDSFVDGSVFKHIGGIIESTYTNARNTFDAFIDGDVFKHIKGVVENVFNTTKAVFDAFVDGSVFKHIKGVVENVFNTTKAVFDAFVDGDVFKHIKGTVEAAFNTAKATFDAFVNKDVFKTVKGIIDNTFTTARQTFNDLTDAPVFKTIKAAVEKAGTWVADAWEAAQMTASTVTKTVQGAVTKASTWVNDAWTVVQTGTSTVQGAVQKAYTWVADAWTAIQAGDTTKTATVNAKVQKDSYSNSEAWKLATETTTVSRRVDVKAQNGGYSSDPAWKLATETAGISRAVSVKAQNGGYSSDPAWNLATGTGVISRTVQLTLSWVNNAVQSVKNWLGIREKGGILTVGGNWRDIPQFAAGGIIRDIAGKVQAYAGGTARAHGSLFLAGEAGPEVVGHVNGRTEVLNRSQIASAIYSAVLAGMETAVNGLAAYIGQRMTDCANAIISGILSLTNMSGPLAVQLVGGDATLAKQLAALTSGVTYAAPAYSTGSIVPYEITAEIRRSTAELKAAIAEAAEEIIQTIISATGSQTSTLSSAFESALREYAGRNGFDPDSFVQYIIDDINRRTQALGVSPLIG